jgi:hypothetical protein
MGTGHCPPPPEPVSVAVPEPAPVVPEPVVPEPVVPEPVVPEVEDVPDLVDDDEDVPVARSAALIEESLNATLAPAPSVSPKKF